jgi:murein DD-endopeptidase MepM/ murein hydrolase activator NlpD
MNLPSPPANRLEKLISQEKTHFTRMVINANGLDPDDFTGWIFHPGMLFGSPDKWWGDRGQRDFPHEGIDVCLYGNRRGQTLALDAQSRIPVMHSGCVKAMFTDYLGQALIVEHTLEKGKYYKFLTVYAHTKPLSGIQIGQDLKAGDIIATIADTHRSKANIRPHLHLSIGIPAPELSYEAFVWNIMRNPDLVRLLNPLTLIQGPYQVLDTPAQVFSNGQEPFR